jgi:phosphate transport system substrate-binding protein
MNVRATTLRSLISVAATASVMATSLVTFVAPTVAPAAASAATLCVQEQGSTTVYPALAHAQNALQGAVTGATWPSATALGCDVSLTANGSGTGLTALLNYFGIGGSSSTVVDLAASSRALKSGNEATNLWGFKVGGDAMVIAVNKNLGISQIKVDEVKGIYNGTITNWNQIAGSSTSGTIVPRSRITGSGSRDDLGTLFGVDLVTAEPATIAASGLARLVTSQDEADAACNNANQMVYTSLANLLAYGPSGSNCLKALSLAAGSTSTYVAPSLASANPASGTYPAKRQLFVATPKASTLAAKFGTAIGTGWTDRLGVVKAQDMVNYMMGTPGQSDVAAVGFVTVTSPTKQAIPDADVNLDGAIGLADIGNITGRWSQSNAIKGWERADVDNNGAVGLSDIGKITGQWGGTGFVAP